VGAKNHKDAIIYMFKLLDGKKELTEQDILEFHHLVLKGIDDQYAGRYRDVQVMIRGAIHNPPSSGKVPIMMRELVNYMGTNLGKLSSVDLSAIMHLEFETIHPFVDGNGRVGRIINNFLLLSAGYPPIIIKINERKKYFEALEESIILGRPEPFIRFIKMKVIDSYKFYTKKEKKL
jgi:Fic family protein